jgi:adenosylcobinamide amidohydrolase
VDHFSCLREERSHDTFILQVPPAAFPAARAVSWAIQGGGFIAPRVIVNHSTGQKGWIGDIYAYVRDFMTTRNLPSSSVVMLTTVNMSFQGTSELRDDGAGLAVRAYATVGLGNALAAGDPGGFPPEIGTINLIVVIAGKCSDEALMEGISIAAEAKTRFLTEHGVRSIRSDALATGTGTDCAVILSLGVGLPVRYVGKHTTAGELIARAVMGAMADSMNLRKNREP